MKKIIPLAIVGILTIATAVWWWRPSQQVPDYLNLSVENVVESFDPVQAYSDDSLSVMAQVLEPLYQYHYLKRPYELIPQVAETMPDVSADGRTYTLTVRSGLYFHDHPAFAGRTRELHAEDFVMALKRMAFVPLKSPFRSFFEKTILGFKEFSDKVGDDWKLMRSTPFEGATATDFKLTLKLTRREPNLIYYLAMAALAPVPWEVVDHHQNNLSNVLVGTGPYEYHGYNDNRYRMKRFGKYREDFYPTTGDRYANVQNLLSNSRERIPFVDNVSFYVINSEEGRWQAFHDGKIDILPVPRGMLTRLLGDGTMGRRELEERGIQVKHFPVQALRWLSFNMRDPLWGTNLKLRQAVAYGINAEAYIGVMSQKTDLKAHSLLVPGVPGYDPSSSFGFDYDLEKGKALLKEAGYPGGKGLPPLRYSTRGSQEANLVEAKFWTEELAKLGIKLETEVLSFTDFLRKGRAGELQFFTDNWLFDYPDGENILQLLLGANSPGINKAGYRNLTVDRLYDELRLNNDIGEKQRLMKQIEEKVMADLPWIPLMYESSYVLLAPHVSNYRKSYAARNYVKYIKLGRGSR